MKKNELPSIINLMILSLITIVLWVFFTIYRAFTKPAILNIPPEVLEPLDPNLNMTVLENLDKRFYLEEGQIPTVSTPTKSPKASPTLLPKTSPEPSVTPNPSPT